MKKLNNCRGETLVESLAAILMISLVFVFLCSSIVAAARSNQQVRETNRNFSYSDMTPQPGSMQVVEKTQGAGIANVYPIVGYQTDRSSQAGEYRLPEFRYFTIRPAGGQEGAG